MRQRRVLYVTNATKIGGGNRVLMDLMYGLDSSRYTPIQTLASALLQLLNDPPARTQMGHQARARVERLFSARIFAQRVQALYDELLIGRS